MTVAPLLTWLVLGIIAAFAAGLAVVALAGRKSAPHLSAGPRCGACDYDTTGLTSLTCPECGADLRVAGIRTGPVAEGPAGFAAHAVMFLAAWILCGVVLLSVLTSLFPYHQYLVQVVRLGNPASRAYQAVDAVADVSGWEGTRPVVRVELQLLPLTGGAATSPARPPAPLTVAPGVSAAHVLGWLAGAGIDTTDPRVRREADAVALAATRSLRTRERLDRSSGFGATSASSGIGGPFGSTTTTVRGGAGRSNLPLVVFAIIWVGVLAAGIVYISRRMRPAGAAATPA